MQSVNIKDVAERANVSVTTVSRVLNNKGYISKQTYKKVHEAMEELNYYPNQLARNLFRKKTFYIGMIIPDINHPFFSELTKYVENKLYKCGYKLMLCNSTEDNIREDAYIKMLQENKVDGIIIGSHLLKCEEYEKIKLPIVSMDMNIGEDIPRVYSDHEKGGRLAAKYLIEKGCKNVVQFVGDKDVNTPAHLRHKSFEEYINSHGGICHTISLNRQEFNEEYYYKIVSDFLDSHKSINGCFAVDFIATRIIQYAYNSGISIPEQLQIISYDGTFLTRATTPVLTCIKQNIPEIAEKLVKILNDKIEGKENVQLESIIDVELREGGTTL